jgi:hypothetical protein
VFGDSQLFIAMRWSDQQQFLFDMTPWMGLEVVDTLEYNILIISIYD